MVDQRFLRCKRRRHGGAIALSLLVPAALALSTAPAPKAVAEQRVVGSPPMHAERAEQGSAESDAAPDLVTPSELRRR